MLIFAEKSKTLQGMLGCHQNLQSTVNEYDTIYIKYKFDILINFGKWGHRRYMITKQITDKAKAYQSLHQFN